MYLVFTKYVHLDPRGVIIAASSITAISTAYVLYLLPEWFGRLILFFATRTVYRVHVIGRDNFPEKGGALLVCNHMSFVDAALLVAATDRPIRFIMHRDIYDHPVVKPFAKMVRAIPLSSEQHPRELLQSLHVASDALRGGGLGDPGQLAVLVPREVRVTSIAGPHLRLFQQPESRSTLLAR